MTKTKSAALALAFVSILCGLYFLKVGVDTSKENGYVERSLAHRKGERNGNKPAVPERGLNSTVDNDVNLLRDPAYLSSVCGKGLTPEIASKYLVALDQEISNIDERSRIASSLIAGLCFNGFSRDAWDLIQALPGQLRRSELRAWFFNSELNLGEVIGCFQTLTEGEDRKAALTVMFNRRMEDYLTFSPSDLKLRSDEEKVWLGLSVVGLVGSQSPGDSISLEPLLGKTMELAVAGAIPISFCVNAFVNVDGSTGVAQFDMLMKQRDNLTEKDFDSLVKPIVGNYIAADPRSGMDRLASDPATRYSFAALNAGLSKYYSISAAEANSWVAERVDSLDKATAQRIIYIVAQEAARSNEYETAAKWSAQLLNPDVRSELEEQIQKHKNRITNNQ